MRPFMLDVGEVYGAMQRADRKRFVYEAVLDPEERIRARMGLAADVKIEPNCYSTISNDEIVRDMLLAVDLQSGSKLLEIGTGTGYSAACAAEVVGPSGKVITIEHDEGLANNALWRLSRYGYENIEVLHGDGAYGFEEEAPYDGIIVTAACSIIPSDLEDQLKDGGKIVLPRAVDDDYGELETLIKRRDGLVRLTSRSVRFVPLVSDSVSGWGVQELNLFLKNNGMVE